jgi:hypothetical protein
MLTFTKVSERLYDIGSQTFVKETPVENPLRLHVGAATLALDEFAVNDENFSVRLADDRTRGFWLFRQRACNTLVSQWQPF